MEFSDRKEQFSIAYVHAVAAAAGVAMTKAPEPDRVSVDVKLTGYPPAFEKCPEVNVQLKCSAGLPVAPDHISFPLGLKNYDDLRKVNLAVPRILIVLAVPENPDEWLHVDEERMLARRCAYWTSLRGAAATTNTTAVTIQLPRANKFDVAALAKIMGIVHNGGFP